MDFLSDMLIFTPFDYVVLAINGVILIVAPKIVSASGLSPTEKSFANSVTVLRIVNIVLFFLYFLAGVFNEYARQLSITGLTLLLAFISAHLLQGVSLRRFGRSKEIEGETVKTHTYQSEIVGLLIWLLATIVSFVIIINAWGMTSWLQATSALGAVLVLIYATKDVWAPDSIHGLILLYNSDIEPGAVVKSDELGLLAVALRISLTQITLRDLRRNHKIIIPNSRFRDAKIEVLSSSQGVGLDCYVDFKLAYGSVSEHVELFLREVWELAAQKESFFVEDKQPRIRLLNNGDHAVTWRLMYAIKNAYRVNEAEFAINRAAYDLSMKRGIGLNTPDTLLWDKGLPDYPPHTRQQ